jgi:lysyl-tRNA synthetase, class II
VISAGVLGLVLLGVRPIEGADTGSNSGNVVVNALAIAVLLAVVALCLAKQRLLHGLVGVFVFPLAIYGASRIGKPRSSWARRFYGERNPRKQTKVERRFAPGRRTDRFKESFRDAVGGTPETEYEAKLAQRDAEEAREAATLEAAEEIRRRAESMGADPEQRST